MLSHKRLSGYEGHDKYFWRISSISLRLAEHLYIMCRGLRISVTSITAQHFFAVQFVADCIEVCFFFICTIELNVLLLSWDGFQDLWMWLAAACAIASFISWLTLTMRVASFPGSSLVFSFWQVARHSLVGFPGKPHFFSRLILESPKRIFF